MKSTLLATAGLTLAASSPANPGVKACKALKHALPSIYLTPACSPLAFAEETTAYWSGAQHAVKPQCIIVPESAEHVATAMNILNEDRFSDVNFAVRSGGHDPNTEHTTVEGGVLISMSGMVGAEYDEDKGVAYVKPGGHWNDVIGPLEESGVTVLGGRLGIVGVGGLLLQGGLSFLSAQHGLAADNIIGWELVTASGEIKNVDAATEPELAVALRGSGSQFGIVTKFTVKAHPIGQVWGGHRIYAPTETDALLAAIHNFISAGNEDPKAAVINTGLFLPLSEGFFIIYYFYDDEELPQGSVLEEFLAIPFLVDSTKTQKYSELLRANGESAETVPLRQAFRTATLPHIPSDPNIYPSIFQRMSELTAEHMSNPLNTMSQCSLDFQPLPSVVGVQSELSGGNAMGLTGSDPDRVVLMVHCGWESEVNDEELRAVQSGMTEWVAEMIPTWTGGEEAYLPIFMNDGQDNQNVTGTYSEYEALKGLQEKMDPEGILSMRLGGHKY